MKLLSQNDLKWKYKQLGTSPKSIGSHGCTITCLSMLADVTPDFTNQRMNAVKGYANGNLVIWSKVPEALPNLKFIKRVNGYNNPEVAANLPCLVEVDGAPIGGYRHWVVFVGNKQLYDPWDGKVKHTGMYRPTGYAIFKVNQINQPLTPAQKEQKIRTIFGQHITSEERLKQTDIVIHS
jgi:hypothetical protein